MTYAELLQEWRAGILPSRDSVGRRREAPTGPNDGHLPALPVLPIVKSNTEIHTAPLLALVSCGQCQHFNPNEINPAQGSGQCSIGADADRLPWPNALRQCSSWNPTRAGMLDVCQTACNGLKVEPETLARWLMLQGDRGWVTPPAVKRWAELIAERGWPE